MSHTLSSLLGLVKSPIRYSPAVCRQASTSVFIGKQNHLLNLTPENGEWYCKGSVIDYSLRTSSYTKQYGRNKHTLMQLRSLSFLVSSDNLEENDQHVSVEVVKDASVVSYEEGDWTDEMNLIRSQENKSVLIPPSDASEMEVFAPELRPSFNLAAYVNKSETLQQLLKLGVNLSRWDSQKGVSAFILPLNFEENMKQYIVFLHDCGVPADDLGRWLTLNPYIFKEKLDDLDARINYLKYMRFSKDQITRLISKNPSWLLLSTEKIDSRLGFFQESFKLTGDEVRYLATKRPLLITCSTHSIKRITFSVVEEMGFEKSEAKSLLLAKPKIWMADGVALLKRFDFAHNHMGLSHAMVVQFPEVLLTRDFKLKQRHCFLKLLSRDQYDSTKPNYVSPKALVSGTDAEFCTNIAKASVQAFNDFLKTL